MANLLKRAGQSLLKRAGLYGRLKHSVVYDLFWRFVDPQLIRRRQKEVEFFRRTLLGLKPGDMIFDIGANEGYKTDIFLRLGARVVAVDPDRTNQEALRANFLTWRWRKQPVTIVGKAVSDREGTQLMWVDEPGSAKNTLSPKWVEALQHDEARFGRALRFAERVEVETTTLEQLIAQHGRPLYVKVDVEGNEPSVLAGLQSAIPYLSFEVNLPEFKDEGLQCIARLEQIAPGGEFNYATDCIRGLEEARWLPKKELTVVFEQCEVDSLEIFWRAPRGAARAPLFRPGGSGGTEDAKISITPFGR